MKWKKGTPDPLLISCLAVSMFTAEELALVCLRRREPEPHLEPRIRVNYPTTRFTVAATGNRTEAPPFGWFVQSGQPAYPASTIHTLAATGFVASLLQKQ